VTASASDIVWPNCYISVRARGGAAGAAPPSDYIAIPACRCRDAFVSQQSATVGIGKQNIPELACGFLTSPSPFYFIGL